MDFPELLKNLNLTDEYDLTKNEFRNYWNEIQSVIVTDSSAAQRYVTVIYDGNQKRYDALNFINKSTSIHTILPQLSSSLVDDMQTIYTQRDNLFQGLLETKDITTRHAQIKAYSSILDALNTLPPAYITNLLDQAIDPGIWDKLSKIQNSATMKWLFENLVFGEISYMIASGFLLLAKDAKIDDLLALIDLYQPTRLDIIRIVDQALNTKSTVTDIHKIFMDKTADLGSKQALLRGLTGNKIANPQDRLIWQQKISTNFFTPAHTDLTFMLGQLILIPQDSILSGLLGLTVKFGHNGYCRVQFLLQKLLKDGKFHPFLAELAKLNASDIDLMLQELVWSNQTDIIVANRFLDFTATLSSTVLSQFLAAYVNSANQTSVFPHLIQSIETAGTTIYPFLCDESGYIYKDLILELQMLDSTTRDNILTDGGASLFGKLQKLDGLPFLLAGVLKIGTRDDPVQKPKENHITDFLDTITNTNHDQQDFKNIAYTINNLGSRQLTRLFVPFIHTRYVAIDRISCDNTTQGRDKSGVLVNALCCADGSIKKLVIGYIFDNKAMMGVTDGLLYKTPEGTWQALQDFINVVDSQSTEDTIVDQYNSFLLADSDPYRFVRLLAQMAVNPTKAAKYYESMMQQSPTDRKQMITDVMTSGQIELLFSNIAQESEAGAVFQQLAGVKKKSPAMYNALLIMLSRTDNAQMQEFRSLITLKMVNTDTYKDLLDGLDALQSADGLKVNYQKVTRFIAEIYNNSNFIEALHQAFDEKIQEEATAHTQFIIKIYDKGLVIDALDLMTLNKSILLMKAFASGYDDLLEALNRVDNVKACQYLLQRFCFDDPKNANYPVSLCDCMMTCLDQIASVDILQSFVSPYDDNKDNLILDFETVLQANKLANPGVLDYTKILLQQDLFMFICKQIPAKIRQDFLTEILGDMNYTLKTFYISSPYTTLPLLAMYGKAGDFSKIETLRQQIASTEGWANTLPYFVNQRKDPYAKLLIALLAITVSNTFEIDMVKLQRIQAGVTYFINLREALFRFASRPNIYLWHIVQLMKFLLEDDKLYTGNGKINTTFRFPYKKLAVAEDDWVYTRYLEALEFYGKK